MIDTLSFCFPLPDSASVWRPLSYVLERFDSNTMDRVYFKDGDPSDYLTIYDIRALLEEERIIEVGDKIELGPDKCVWQTPERIIVVASRITPESDPEARDVASDKRSQLSDAYIAKLVRDALKTVHRISSEERLIAVRACVIAGQRMLVMPDSSLNGD